VTDQLTFCDPDEDGFPRPKELYRRDNPDTSREAAEHMVYSGKLGERMQWALDLVRANPGATCSELTPGVNGSVVGKRLNDLRKKGLVIDRGVKRCPVTKRNARRWWPIEEAPITAD